jgi:GAF domain-containing protein
MTTDITTLCCGSPHYWFTGESWTKYEPPTNLRSGNSMILPTISRCTPSIASSLPSRRPARRVGTLVARGVEPSEVGGAVAEELRRCLGAITAGLWRFETSGEITLVAAAANPAALARWPVGTRTPIEGDTLATVMQRTGLPARIDSYETIPGSVAARVRAVGVRAAVGVPIIVDGNVWGLAAVGSQEPGPMPADTETRISRFAELIATALVAGCREEQEAVPGRDSAAAVSD